MTAQDREREWEMTGLRGENEVRKEASALLRARLERCRAALEIIGNLLADPVLPLDILVARKEVADTLAADAAGAAAGKGATP